MRLKLYSDADLPAYLWHYTDASGLHGILTTGKVRVGHIAALNDETELIFGLDIIDSMLQCQIDRGGKAGDYFTFVRDALKSVARADNIYTFSLSGNHDVISQWQRYAANGFGYAVGFRATPHQPPHNATVRAVQLVYQADQQRRRIQAVITNLRNTAAKSWQRRQFQEWEGLELALFTQISRLTNIALALKTPHFADEAEWRLISRSFRLLPDSPTVIFVPRGDYVKAYLEIPILPALVSAQARLSLATIICGPRLNQALAVKSLKLLLDSLELRDVTVQTSQLTGVWR